MDLVDLHVHTTYSDGTVEPKYIVAQAAMQGLKAIAITDHDTMLGVQEAGEAGAMMGVSIIPGIEISTDYKGEEVHVLGYFLDPDAPAMQEYYAFARESRRVRNQRIVEKLNAKGFHVVCEDTEDRTYGRPQIARQLMEQGVVSSVSEAFRRYLSKGRSCYVERERIPFADAAKLITRCGGVAVLAHPLQYGYKRDELDALVKTAAECGFKGIEIYYSGYTKGDIDKLFTLAEKYMLLPTGGSDFHGDNKPENKLGGVQVPAYFLIMLARSQFE